MKWINKCVAYFNRILMACAMVCLCGVCLFCIIQVTCRFVLHTGSAGTEEITKLCFSWMVCLCSGLCVKDKTNPSISIFADFLHGKAKIAHDAAIHLIIIAFGITLIVLGIPYASSAMATRLGTLSISISWLYASIIVAGISISVNGVNNMIHFVAALFDQNLMNPELGGAES